MIESKEAFRFTKELMRQESIFAGISSGSVVCCATKLAEKMEKGNIVCLLADGGWKYLSTSLWTSDFADMKDSVEYKIWW